MKRRIRVAHLSDLHVCHNLTTLANLFWDFVRLSGPPLSVRAALQRILDDPLRRDQLTRLLFRQKDAPEKLSPFKLLAWGVVSMPVAIYLIKQVLNFKRAFYISMDFPDRREVLLRHLEEQHVDHVVVSGDLSNAAHPRELGIAREFLDRLGGRERVSVIPGNHDVSMHNTVLSGISSVEEKLEDFLGSFRDYIPDQFPDPIAMEKTTLFPYLRLIDQSIALIGLDSTTYHPVLNVRGLIDPAQLETLRLLLRHPDVRRRFTIVMLHHHVTQTPIDDSQNGVVRRLYDRIERSFMDKLDNAREVKELLTRSRVDLILHGHQHHTYKTFMGNIRVFCSGSSIYPGTDGDIRPFYEIYTLQDLHLSVESWYHDGQTFVSACPV